MPLDRMSSMLVNAGPKYGPEPRGSTPGYPYYGAVLLPLYTFIVPLVERSGRAQAG